MFYLAVHLQRWDLRQADLVAHGKNRWGEGEACDENLCALRSKNRFNMLNQNVYTI